MYIFKNALKSITKSKNILIGVIVIVIASLTCIALSVNEVVSHITKNYKDFFDITANLILDKNFIQQDAIKKNNNTQNFNPQAFLKNIPELTVQMIEKYGTSIYVKNYNYIVRTNLKGELLEKVTIEDKSNMLTGIEKYKR